VPNISQGKARWTGQNQYFSYKQMRMRAPNGAVACRIWGGARQIAAQLSPSFSRLFPWSLNQLRLGNQPMTTAPILIIDDDASQRRLIEFWLQGDGCRSVTAEDGKAGLCAFEQRATG
jgi:hypothetical protein